MKERKTAASAASQTASRSAPGHAGRVEATDTPRQQAQEVRIAQLSAPIAQANRTGLPDKLRSGIEALSGMDMSGVQVHRNSSKPAALQAHAYAQGSDIHLGPGQEKHLPHEAWHVVQQRQGRVQATTAVGGVGVNDSPSLEREADRMGAQALQAKTTEPQQAELRAGSDQAGAVQRKVGFEFQTYDSVTFQSMNEAPALQRDSLAGRNAGSYSVVADSGAGTDMEVEIKTVAVDETGHGRATLVQQMQDISALAGGIVDGMTVNTLNAGGVTWEVEMANYRFAVNQAVHFHPQATVGVKFEKIADLIDHATQAPFMSGGQTHGLNPQQTDPQIAQHTTVFGWSAKDDQRPFRQPWAQAVADARQDMGDASANAVSFASLLYGFAYVTEANHIPEDPSYAKYFMPFLLRLGLLPHFGTLTPQDRQHLRDRIRDEVKQSQFLPLQFNEIVGDPFTIQQMLTALGQGRDLPVDQGIHGYGGYARNHKALGMANETDIGASDTEPQRNGAVIELRKLGNDVAPGDLSAYALAVFDFIQLINQPQQQHLAPQQGNNQPPPPNNPQGGRQRRRGQGCKCFLTTACCEWMGLPDECAELTTLRAFRDGYLALQPGGPELIERYYELAPRVLDALHAHPDRQGVLASIYGVVTACVADIRADRPSDALQRYARMTTALAHRFCPELAPLCCGSDAAARSMR